MVMWSWVNREWLSIWEEKAGLDNDPVFVSVTGAFANETEITVCKLSLPGSCVSMLPASCSASALKAVEESLLFKLSPSAISATSFECLSSYVFAVNIQWEWTVSEKSKYLHKCWGYRVKEVWMCPCTHWAYRLFRRQKIYLRLPQVWKCQWHPSGGTKH